MKKFFTRLWASISAFWKARSLATKVILVCVPVILIAISLSFSRSVRTAPKAIEKRLYGEEIGRNGLRYKHGAHIYNPETNEILVDSIEWLHVSAGDTIAILAKNHRRAFINLNNAQLITPLDYERAWEFSCDRGIMSRHDSLFIFRRDGSQVNQTGLKTRNQYEYLFNNNHLVLNVDYDHVGLLDTAGQWVLEPVYSKIETSYNRRLYNTKLGDECIVYDYNLQPVLKGAYKAIEIDWSEGLIATEYNGIQHLFDYDGKLVYQVIYKSIEELSYNTHRKDGDDRDIYEETDCFIYVDYNNKRGLMDKHYHVLTPPLFHSIEAQTKHVFFASFGEYSDRFGTLIDDHGKALR
jgi:hypothetical protein